MVDENTITNLQQVTYRLAITGAGVITSAEKDHARHEWEEWIIVSAKCRVILTLDCFDCVFTTRNDLPTFPCDELRLLPAPAGKVLWQAQSSEQWKTAYNRWLAKWDTSTFTIGDLMKKPNGDTDAEERLQTWLSEVDKLGMMMMVVVNGARSTISF